MMAMNRNASLAVLLCAAALAACEKNAVQDLTGPLPSASIRFFNFGVNAPSVNFYADETKMTGVLSTTNAELTTGVGYGGVGAAGYYSGIDPGEYTVSGRITAAGDDKKRPISNVPVTIEAGKTYSFYQSGFYNTTAKTVDGFVVEDPFIPEFDYAVAYVRFVNAISNSEPMTLHVTDDNTGEAFVVGGAVPYKSAGQFTALPNGVYDLATRHTGSSTDVIIRANVSFSAGRIYTITARGDMTVVSTTATNRPFLDNTTNR